MSLDSVITLTILLATAANADLGFIDFEDLTVGDQIHYATSLMSDGATLTGDTFVYSGGGTTDGGFAEIQAGGAAGGSGNELWFNNLNVDFDFGGSITHLILNYGEYGGQPHRAGRPERRRRRRQRVALPGHSHADRDGELVLYWWAGIRDR